jgi:two-component system nitrate/nitrite response regulator NarL
MTRPRVLLVGSSPDRARLRAKLGSAAVEIVAEFSTLAAARAADLDYDGLMIAGESPSNGSSIDGVPSRGSRSWPADEEEPQEPLTPREVQVLELLAEGLPNKAIAARLHISDQTVKFHVSAICGKLGAANRTDAVRRAVRRGLITL